MLVHPTQEQLRTLKLNGMAKAFDEVYGRADADALSHAEWLAILLEREATWRADHRLKARLRYARLRHHAAPEDVDYNAARGLDRGLFQMLLKGAWIDAAECLIISGATGLDSYCTPRYLIETQGFAGADRQKADGASAARRPRA